MESASYNEGEIEPRDSVSQIVADPKEKDDLLSLRSTVSQHTLHLRALAKKAKALAELDVKAEKDELELAEMQLKNKKEQVRLTAQIKQADALVALLSSSSNSHISTHLQMCTNNLKDSQDDTQAKAAESLNQVNSLIEWNQASTSKQQPFKKTAYVAM